MEPKGNLYASSRSKVFDEGLTSKKMNPEAFTEIAISKKTEFIHDERIGKLKYLSSYIPFKNKDGVALAYVNIPYFAKQSELEKEISGPKVGLMCALKYLFPEKWNDATLEIPDVSFSFNRKNNTDSYQIKTHFATKMNLKLVQETGLKSY